MDFDDRPDMSPLYQALRTLHRVTLDLSNGNITVVFCRELLAALRSGGGAQWTEFGLNLRGSNHISDDALVPLAAMFADPELLPPLPEGDDPMMHARSNMICVHTHHASWSMRLHPRAAPPSNLTDVRLDLRTFCNSMSFGHSMGEGPGLGAANLVRTLLAPPLPSRRPLRTCELLLGCASPPGMNLDLVVAPVRLGPAPVEGRLTHGGVLRFSETLDVLGPRYICVSLVEGIRHLHLDVASRFVWLHPQALASPDLRGLSLDLRGSIAMSPDEVPFLKRCDGFDAALGPMLRGLWRSAINLCILELWLPPNYCPAVRVGGPTTDGASPGSTTTGSSG